MLKRAIKYNSSIWGGDSDKTVIFVMDSSQVERERERGGTLRVRRVAVLQRGVTSHQLQLPFTVQCNTGQFPKCIAPPDSWARAPDTISCSLLDSWIAQTPFSSRLFPVPARSLVPTFRSISISSWLSCEGGGEEEVYVLNTHWFSKTSIIFDLKNKSIYNVWKLYFSITHICCH